MAGRNASWVCFSTGFVIAVAGLAWWLRPAGPGMDLTRPVATPMEPSDRTRPANDAVEFLEPAPSADSLDPEGS